MNPRLKRTLAFAATLSLIPIPLFALPANSGSAPASTSTSATAGKNEAMHMVPATVVLLDTIDAKKMQPGSDFQAKLAGKVQLKNGPELPSGTILDGTVAADDMNVPGNSKLAIRFTHAKLKDGQVVPIKATIVSAFTNPGVFTNQYGGYGSVPNSWNDGTLAVDQINVTSGVDLHSKISSQNSGVFVTARKDDVKLAKGSDIDLAIAQATGADQNSAGMTPSGF